MPSTQHSVGINSFQGEDMRVDRARSDLFGHLNNLWWEFSGKAILPAARTSGLEIDKLAKKIARACLFLYEDI